MPKKDHLTLSAEYSVCELSDCRCAATCLHQIAYTALVKTEKILRLLNPTMCVKDASCPYYRNSEPVTYARGFTNFQKKMFPGQYDKFRRACIAKFSRTGFFMRRRGELAIPPKEQAFILEALRKAGVTAEMTYDSYEQQQNWVD